MLKENKKLRQRWCLGTALMTLFFVTAPFFSAMAQMMYAPQNEEFNFPKYYYGGEDRTAKFNEIQFVQVTANQTDWSGEYIFSRTVYNGMQSGLGPKDASLDNFSGSYSYPTSLITVASDVITSGAGDCMVIKVKKQGNSGYTLFNSSTGKYIDVDANGLVETSAMPTEFWTFYWLGSNNQVRISRTYNSTTYYLKGSYNSGNSVREFCLSTSPADSDANGYSPRLFKKTNYYFVRGGESEGLTGGKNYHDSFYSYAPFQVNYAYVYKQILYPKDSLVAGNIKSIAFYSPVETSGTISRNVVIYMKEIDNDDPTTLYSKWVDITTDDAKKVFDGTVTVPTAGWHNINLSTVFTYNGTNDIVVAIYDKTGSSPSTGVQSVVYRSYITSSNPQRYKTSTTEPKSTNTNWTAAPPATPVNSSGVIQGSPSSARPWARFVIEPAVSEPVFNPSAGTYNEPQEVAITCTESEAQIYYTTDGSTPSTDGTLYSAPIHVDENATLKAIAVKGAAASSVSAATYEFQPLPPTFQNTGTHSGSATVTIVAGDTYTESIYYTTDGSTPSASNGTLYSGPFTVTTETTVTAVAVKAGWSDSQSSTGHYMILKPNGMSPDDNPDGLVLSKSFTPDGTDGNNSGLLTLESYVTGESVTISNVVAPTDIVLVLDYSSSMGIVDIPYTTTTGVSSKQSRIDALKASVTSFLGQIADASNQPSGEFDGMHHRVAFVTYGDKGRLWYGDPTDLSQLAKGDTAAYTGPSVFSQAFYEVNGTGYNHSLAWSKLAFKYGSTEDNYTEVEYAMPLVQGIFDNNPTEISGVGNRNRMVVVFTDGGIGHGNWIGSVDPNNMEYAEGKANYTLRKANLMKNSYDATFYSVGIFPDEPLNHENESSPYFSLTLPDYHPYESGHGDDYKEYSAYWADNVSRFMALRSSNYPHAVSMTTTGTGSNSNGYFIIATDAAQLTDAFSTISQTIATPSMSLSSQTVVEDVISDAFMLPAGTSVDDIKVYTANCTGVNPYTFGTPQLFAGAQVSIEGKHIYVTNFDFTANWCGENTSTHVAHGKKLILEIPIVRDMSGSAQGGTFNTNANESGVYNESGSQVGAFLSPQVYLSAPEGCFDFEDVTGTAYNAAGNLPAGWHGYITNTSGSGGVTLYPPHVVSGSTHNFPYDGEQSLLLASGYYTNAISYATMPAMYFTAGNDMELNFYYKTEGTGNGECSLAIGYVTSIPADNSSDWASAFHSLETLPASAQSESGSVFTVNLSGVPTNEDVYITFKWYCNYDHLLADRNCYIDGVCVQEPSTPHLWTEFVTSYSQTVKSGTPTFVVDDVAKTITISSEEALAWLISYVNGFNGCTANNLSGYTVTLTKDLNMNAYVWVPIGLNDTKPFSGTFDGQYRTIDGIHIKDATELAYVETSSVGTNGDMIYTGMYGYVDGATIRNTFITSGRLASDGVDGNIGAIAGYANNSAFEFCETAVNIEALSGDIYSIGGIAGKVEGSSSSVKAVMVVGDINLYLSGNIDYAGSLIGYSDFDANIVPETFYTNHHISGTPWTKNMAGTNSYVRIFNNGYADGYKPNTDYTLASAYTYGSYSTNNTIGGTPMVDLLNNDANLATGYKWIRAAGSSINGGYPIVYPIAADSLACVAKIGSNVLRFGELNEMLEKYADSTNYEIFMYNNDSIYTLPGNSKLYIDEHVAMKQNNGLDIPATVSITLDNSKGTAEMQRDWHMFSTSLQKAPLGIKYTENEYQSQHGYLPNAANYLAFGTDYWIDENGYFPAGIAYRTQFDFYSYYEPQYHWINLKRKPNNHWHEDEPHTNIAYTGDFNQTYLEKGKGYLVALGNTTENNNLMQTSGKLTNGDVDYTITASGEHLKGYNLMGNPYQSYLDFNAFATENEDLIWSSEGDTGYMAYLIFNADAGGFEEYLIDNNLVGFSQGAATTTSRYLNMHQGFFIVKTTADSDEVTFTNDMRVVTPNAATFRSDVQPTYPLVNLFCTDSDGKRETVIMEFERPLKAGSTKMKGMLNGKCNMYAHWGNDDLGAVFIDYMPDYVPVWFEAAEDGVFTITWNTANANFGYMHLIDNIAGVDYDCLAPGNDHYTFTSSTTDMVARFRVVFKPLGIDEVDGEVNGDFAFFNGEELIVNGEGELSLIDVNGRVLTTRYVTGQQSAVALPTVAEGMYLLRLTRANDVKVQKIVIRK